MSQVNDVNTTTASPAMRFRATHLFPSRSLEVTENPDGSLLLTSGPLDRAVPPTLAKLLAVQAERLTTRTFIAQRGDDSQWREVSYRDFKTTADAVAGWLRCRRRPERQDSSDDRVLIVTGNSIAHAELVFGAGAAGVPVCPVSPQYALAPGGEYGRLRHVVDLLRPTIVFAERVEPIARALRQVLPPDVTMVCRDAESWPSAVAWDDVRGHEPTSDPDVAIDELDPGAPLRFMLTSGSTGLPKIVVQTNRMWCSLVTAASAVIGEASGWGVRTLDWMPWSHVSGISVLIGALANGGTYYLDDGRPTPELFGRTLRNLAEVQPLFFANVPYAFGMLCDALEADAALRSAFFEHLQLCLYGGAGLAQPVYDRFQAMAEQTIGERIMFTTGYGSTETTAGVMSISWPTTKVGVGLPLPGIEVKLLPVDDERYEVRFRAPCVMPGYLDNLDATMRAFDDDGFYRSGDTLAFVDRSRPEEGLIFAGRTAEEFKLSTGTFVPGGRLHNDVIAATTPVVLETMVCGEGRDEVGLLMWLNPAGCAAALGVAGQMAELATDVRVLDWIAERLAAMPGGEHGSAGRVARFAILVEPPDSDAGELSDKGSINQSISQRRRAADVDRLYSDAPTTRLVSRTIRSTGASTGAARDR